jgi:hypothetical protein
LTPKATDPAPEQRDHRRQQQRIADGAGHLQLATAPRPGMRGADIDQRIAL